MINLMMPAGLLNPSAIGRWVLDFINYGRGYGRMFLRAVTGIGLFRIPPIRRVFFKQIYFTGIEAWLQVSLIAALIGLVIIAEVTNLAGSNAELTGKILVWTIVRELGPLFSAIIIIARSGTAVVSELGSMKVSGEVDTLRMLGIDPNDYLILPRITGITVSVFILTFYFQMMSVAGGLALTSMFFADIPLVEHLQVIARTLSLKEIAISLSKSLTFGAIISTVFCFQGYGVKSSITEIPQAATRAVMQSLFMIFVSDGIITLVSFL